MQNGCELCAPIFETAPSGSRCAECRAKGDVVGTVVWDIVTEAVLNSEPSDRVMFMLAGLPAVFLEGIARQAPGNGQQIEGRSLHLAMNPSAAYHLKILPPAVMSTQSAVHWRHSTKADVIVFAPPDSEREGIGAGLQPIARIDSPTIVDQTSSWLKILDETDSAESYMGKMLRGLQKSRIYVDLEMWAAFILAVKRQGFALLPHQRVQKSAPALQIPRDGIVKLPQFRPGETTKVSPQKFCSAFEAARAEVGVYATLKTPKQEQVDTQTVREAVDAYNYHEEEDTLTALQAVSELLDDEHHIRPGRWRHSQREFCERVSWDLGSQLFRSGRRTTQPLGEQTLEFLDGNHSEDLTQDDRRLLELLSSTAPKDPRDEELEFFARWKERLSHPEAVRIFKGWQKRLFAKQVLGHDLLSAFSAGFEALIIAGSDNLVEMREPRILIRTTQHNKAMFWKKLDVEIQKLFRFELRAVQGLLGDTVLWDLDACFNYDATGTSNASDSIKIDLELYLVEASDTHDLVNIKTLHRSIPRVRVVWQPGIKPKDEPISLALVDDVAAVALAAQREVGLFRKQVFGPEMGKDGTQTTFTQLTNINSFCDVAQNNEGRTFDATGAEEDALTKLRSLISSLQTSRILKSEAAAELTNAANTFEEAYRAAIQAVQANPRQGFQSDLINVQANAFGRLCRACRQHATNERTRREMCSLVAEIGIVASSDSSPTMAIVTAWHPLRLAERRAKIVDLGQFVKSALESDEARNADLTIAFEERQALMERWTFPEVCRIQETTMISVEDVAGYSLMVPVDCVSHSQEALERSAPLAADKFVDGMDQYLEVYPHEATNLSVAIFDSESPTLPIQIARRMAQRIYRDPELRFDLMITHNRQGQMRSIFRDQNVRLETENIQDIANGFLSRLRVYVEPSVLRQDDAIHDVDIVFLHDALCHHAKPVWEVERGEAENFNSAFDLTSTLKPRRRLTETGASGIGIYLTLPRPPRAVAEYHDLIYTMDRGYLQDGHHGVLIRHIQFDDANVVNLVRQAHKLAKWVVSYETVSSRTLLEKCGIEIIRDISVPESNEKVIISAGKIDSRLKSKVRVDLIEACGVNNEVASNLSRKVLKDVVQISGQKILTAARLANASHEIIGLSLMRAQIEAALPRDRPEYARPIWISLDDYRGWFSSGQGKVADALGITVLDIDSGFELLVQVGEAKFIGVTSRVHETREALKQVRASVDWFKRNFIDNDDPISRTAWCGRLAKLLVSRDSLSDRLPIPDRRDDFLESLCSGDVTFRISGEAVICLHDAHWDEPALEADVDMPYIRHHILPTPIIRQTLQFIDAGRVPDREGLQADDWYVNPDQVRGISRVLSPEQPAHTSPTTDLGTDTHQEMARTRLDGSQNRSEVAEQPKVETPSEINPTIATQADSISSAEIPAEDIKPRFVPEPLHSVLKTMADTEEEAVNDPASVAWVRQTCQKAQRALSTFGMQAHFAEPQYRLTPNGALITFLGHETLTVKRVEQRISELLTTHGIEVVDIRPRPGQISLFVKRDKRAKVPLASTWLSAPWPDRDPGDMTNFMIGAREDDDRLLFLNLADDFAGYEEHGPHTLIAGGTGSGKGVLTQGLLLQLIAFNNPKRAELILIDPKKGVDFSWISGTPHLRSPIITDIQGAERVFDDLVRLMDERYECLAKIGAQNIAHYNRQVDPHERMSRIFLFHDEMGAWMAQEKEYQEIVLSAVSNLGMKARAAGIHFTLITQRADADAVPPRLRDNMGNRLCLRVQNTAGSRMVLAVGGAQKLLGKGHLACVLANQSPPPGQEYFVVQVPFAEPEHMQRLAGEAIRYWREQNVSSGQN